MELKVMTDSGKSRTKYTVKEGAGALIPYEFATSVRESETDDGPHIALYGGKRYVVAEEGRGLDPNTTVTDKNNEIHKISTLVAICNLIQKQNEAVTSVKATVNMPYTEFSNVKKRDKVKKEYDGKIEITVDGNYFSFQLEVTPYYEGSGLAMRNIDVLKRGGECAVYIMGSHNDGLVVFGPNGKPIDAKSDTFVGGFDAFLLDVKKEIARETGDDLEPYEITQVLMGSRELWITQGMRNVASKIATEHLNKRKTLMKKKGINPERAPIIFGGGGAKVLRNHIRIPFPPHKTIIDPDDVNADLFGSGRLLK